MLRSFSTCKRCGKIFSPAPEQRLCTECLAHRDDTIAKVAEAIDLYKKNTLAGIVAHTGLSEAEVRAALRHLPRLSAAVDVQRPCTKCQEQAAQPGSDYCYNCRLELHQSLFGAAEEIADRIHANRPRRPIRKDDLVKTVTERRRRSGSDISTPGVYGLR